MSDNKYIWAANMSKLSRALAACGVGSSEEQVKEKYRELGGAFVGNDARTTGADTVEVEVEPVKVDEVPADEAEPVVEVPVEETPAVEPSKDDVPLM